MIVPVEGDQGRKVALEDASEVHGKRALENFLGGFVRQVHRLVDLLQVICGDRPSLVVPGHASPARVVEVTANVSQ